ncbi:DUF4157 domain-containing protein [Aureimonas leprariae]|uniref:DUF4157 domain-containing protein n=2 Tax=Plantimonas leprariae TaxID=2615207 RepID=A0A7V7PRR5_9HYPH|nr:DUF4157 domain-containing protein [Aureimonas leprariae]
MPEIIRPYGQHVRCMAYSAVPGNINIPSVALKHLGKANAITLIDVIVFSAIPDVGNPEGKNLWAHELWHTKQYADLGLQGFASRYVAEETGFHPSGNPVNQLETEAVVFSCKTSFIDNPGYWESCTAALAYAGEAR